MGGPSATTGTAAACQGEEPAWRPSAYSEVADTAYEQPAITAATTTPSRSVSRSRAATRPDTSSVGGQTASTRGGRAPSAAGPVVARLDTGRPLWPVVGQGVAGSAGTLGSALTTALLLPVGRPGLVALQVLGQPLGPPGGAGDAGQIGRVLGELGAPPQRPQRLRELSAGAVGLAKQLKVGVFEPLGDGQLLASLGGRVVAAATPSALTARHKAGELAGRGAPGGQAAVGKPPHGIALVVVQVLAEHAH